MRRILFAFFILFNILLSNTLHSQMIEFLSDEEKYRQLIDGVDLWINSPLVTEDSVIFFYKGEAQKVIVAGDFNDWKVELRMELQDTNNKLWVLRWDKRLDKGVYQYKLIVDNIWISDPFNTNYFIDQSGYNVSYFTLSDDFIPGKIYPLWMEGNTYIFRYYNTDVHNVSLVGDFNNWNPYADPMEYIGAGIFEISIDLKPGFHVYCFVADDDWIPDPDNLNQYSDETGNIVNVMYIEGPLTPY